MSTLRLETPRAFAPLISPRSYKGAKGGRGSAKSHWFAGKAVVDCLTEPTRMVCIREFQRSTKESVKRLLEDKIAAMGVSSRFRPLESEIQVLDPPGVIVFQGMQSHNAETIKSLEGYRRAWIEEAQSLSQRSLDLLIPTIRAPGSEIWASWNPNDPKDPIDRFFAENVADPDFVSVVVTWRDNPWFPDKLRRDMEREWQRDPAKARHIWEGEYASQTERQVFTHWRVEPMEAPADAVWRQGADWGFARDPSVLVKCCIIQRPDERDILLVRHAVAGVGVEFDATPGLFAKVPGAKAAPITADAANPQMISYMRRAGFRMREAIKGKGSIEEGVRFLQGFDIVIHPDCDPIVAEECANYSFKTDPLTGEVLPLLEDKWNNAIDALRYACEAVRRAPAKVKPDPKVKRDSDYRGIRPEEEDAWLRA